MLSQNVYVGCVGVHSVYVGCVGVHSVYVGCVDVCIDSVAYYY